MNLKELAEGPHSVIVRQFQNYPGMLYDSATPTVKEWMRKRGFVPFNPRSTTARERIIRHRKKIGLGP